MNGALTIFGVIAAAILSLAFTGFCIAWVTILPTIGLLWTIGWLQ